MDHIQSYFSKIVKTLTQKNNEKEIILFCIKNSSGISLKSSDFVFKNNVLKIKIFGPKRTKILEKRDELIRLLKEKGLIIQALE